MDMYKTPQKSIDGNLKSPYYENEMTKKKEWAQDFLKKNGDYMTDHEKINFIRSNADYLERESLRKEVKIKMPNQIARMDSEIYNQQVMDGVF